jgi:hypothetical protein
MQFREFFISMMRYTRPHLSEAEEEYIEKFIRPVCDYTDEFGNLICATVSNPRIMFSSHTDTVHNKSGKQKLFTNKGKVLTSDSTCLGADDTVGNYLMLSMIDNNIPGLYVFHRGEERGGLGSSFIAEQTPDLLKGVEIAIALDRKGKDDVVQFQMGSRCCSEKFAKQLASLMGITGGDMNGSFTDTANYVDLVTECSNISVAYWDQHSKKERCDMELVGKIEERLLSADFNSLEAHGYEAELDAIPRYVYSGQPGYSKGFTHDNRWDLYDLCQREPHKVARFLDEAGITEDDIMYAEVNEDWQANGNNYDSFGTTTTSTEVVPYVSPGDGVVTHQEMMVDQFGRYVYK